MKFRFLAILKEKYKKIYKDSFISLIKSETSDFLVEKPNERGMSRLNKMNKVVDDKIAEDDFNEYQYEGKEFTPRKNPLKSKGKELTPRTQKSQYGLLLLEDQPQPENEEQKNLMLQAQEYSKKDKKRLSYYIDSMISGKINIDKFNKLQLQDIVIKLRYKELQDSLSGKGLRKKRFGRGMLPRNPRKKELNDGKFVLDMDKLKIIF